MFNTSGFLDFDGKGYPSSAKDYAGPKSGEYRMTRGGAYDSYADNCTVDYRGGEEPEYDDNDNIGFRVVRSASK